MARRTVIIGLVVVLTQLATGCCCCKLHRERKAQRQGMAASIGSPCGCACSSPVNTIPYVPAEPLPAPRKMPAAGVNFSGAAPVGVNQ